MASKELGRNEFRCRRCREVRERPAKQVKCLGCNKRVIICFACLPIFVGCDKACAEAQRERFKEIQRLPTNYEA